MKFWGLKFLKLVPLLRSKVKTLYRGVDGLGEIVFGPSVHLNIKNIKNVDGF